MGCCGGKRRRPARAKRTRAVSPEAAAAARARAGSAKKPEAPPRQPVRKAPPPGRASARAAAYTIVRGDTMAGIARRFGMTAKELVKYDGGTGVPNIMRLRSRNAHVIEPGETILVPRKKAD